MLHAVIRRQSKGHTHMRSREVQCLGMGHCTGPHRQHKTRASLALIFLPPSSEEIQDSGAFACTAVLSLTLRVSQRPVVSFASTSGSSHPPRPRVGSFSACSTTSVFGAFLVHSSFPLPWSRPWKFFAHSVCLEAPRRLLQSSTSLGFGLWTLFPHTLA